MKYGIGIDTGGTYTDAVVFDFENREVLSSHKALTTKNDLSIGILNALDGLDKGLVQLAETVSLSTTLATNACVEHKGARSKLIFIGVNPKTVEWVGKEAGLNDPSLIRYADPGNTCLEVDWNSFVSENGEWLSDAQALGIVDIDSMNNQALREKTAKSIFSEKYSIPIICGYELSSGLNSIRRGASALLNGRLVPVMNEFLESIGIALAKRGITAPVSIMRSDGSLMSKQFTGECPVETILCGPAASVVGGSALLQEQDAVIVDMGGTTTDIALVREGIAAKATSGVQIGQWKTAVKGILVRTLGLGGDSAVRYDSKGNLYLDSVRVMSLSAASSRWPEIVPKLEALLKSTKRHTQLLHELFYLVKDISGSALYTEEEKLMCECLKDAPLLFSELAHAAGVEPYNLNTARLEREGVIMRCGLTPTDIMHIKGDYCAFSDQAARLGASFVASCTGMDVETLCNRVYDDVKKRLFISISEMLLREELPLLDKTGLDKQMSGFIEHIWEKAHAPSQTHLDICFSTPSTIVGIGAPIHIFLPDVAEALGARCVVPPLAGVVNALGSVAGSITATCTVDIKPSDAGYVVYSCDVSSYLDELDDAVALASKVAKDAATAEATRRGACGDVIVELDITTVKAQTGYGNEVHIRTKVTATAIGALTL